MDRFLKGFKNEYFYDLVDEINDYAKENNLNIVQVSYSADIDFHESDRAIVLFEKTNWNLSKNRRVIYEKK